MSATPVSSTLQPLGWVGQLYRDKLMAVVGTFVVAVGALVVLSPLLPFDATAQNLRMRLLPPLTMSPTGTLYLLGTDQLGRDVASRLVYGARVSLAVGVLVPAFAVALGLPLGLIAGFRRGWLGDVIMRVVDLWMSLPPLLVALVVLYVVGAGLANLVLVLAVARWVVFGRLAYALTLSIQEELYIEAAHCIGCSGPRIVARHVLPNMVSQVAIVATLEIARAILSEAALSFLGLGIQPPDSSWGSMLAEGREYMYNAPWLIVLPGIAIVLVTLSINFVVSWRPTLASRGAR